MSHPSGSNLTVVQAGEFPSDSATWAGPGRRRGEICVGFDDGRFRLFDLELRTSTSLSGIFGSGEAINGVVLFGESVAVTTRASIEARDRSGRGEYFSGDRGAFGIAGNGAGTVVAPMGPSGLFYLESHGQGRWSSSTIHLDDETPHFYQTVFVARDAAGRDVYASACRRDGLAVTSIDRVPPPDSTARFIKTWAFEKLGDADVVGVCPLNLADSPLGVAFLEVDGTVTVVPDVSGHRCVEISGLPIAGTPDSIQCAQGHLFLLSSDRLYAVKDLVRRALADGDGSFQPEIKSFAVDAVDFAIVDAERLVVIDDDRVFSHPIAAVFESGQGWDAGQANLDASARRNWKEIERTGTTTMSLASSA